ncbi:MAG: peptide antibiotic transporter SbmA [Pseudomonadota bacterium]
MFQSFFPNPRLFLLTGGAWALFCVLVWNFFVYDWTDPLGIAALTGWDPNRVWLYQFNILCYVAFTVGWMMSTTHRWARWSVGGSALIVFVTWFQVQISVMVNEWYGSFFDLIQQALAEPNAVALDQYYSQLMDFAWLAGVFIFTAVLAAFFTQHYTFRWREALNDRYVDMWHDVRHIEGASQRIQEDTMRFSRIMEALGSRFIDAVMTLIAFLPLLWELSENVPALPLIGEVPGSLVWVALIWSIGGTLLLAVAGIRLPGLEFRNQRVEAAFRKELVIGEDNAERAEPITLGELFSNVRKNYFNLYLNYLYFNIFRFGYGQAGVVVPLILLAPVIVAGSITFGIFQRILNAFNQVENSFQFLVNSWTTIVELMSIYKRLRAFEAAARGEELSEIEFEPESQATRA